MIDFNTLGTTFEGVCETLRREGIKLRPGNESYSCRCPIAVWASKQVGGKPVYVTSDTFEVVGEPVGPFAHVGVAEFVRRFDRRSYEHPEMQEFA